MHGYLEPGEEVRLEARPHGIALLRPLGRVLLVAASGAALVVFGSPSGWWLGALGAFALAGAALAALFAVWRWDRTHVVLTNEKLFVVHGVAQRRAAAVRLARVQAVEMEQSLAGRLLGYGTIVAGSLEIPFVPDPRRVCSLAA